MPSRRALLASLASASAVAVAGCVDDSGGASLTQTAERRSSPTPTGPLTGTRNCTEPIRLSVPEKGDGDEVEPRTYPELPDDLTAATAESFVEEFERAYVVNRAIERNELGDFEFVSWGVDGTTEVHSGYRVTLGGHIAEYMAATETSTIHGDVWYTAHYLVTSRAVWRVEGDGEPDPKSGSLLVCSPDR